MMNNRPIIIIKKKKKVQAAHHGGSWKVAYADFVTAMMAFFMVMWIMGMDQGVKDMVQGYFQNPVGFKRSFSGGANIISQGNSIINMQLQDAIIMRRLEEQQRMEEAASGIRDRLGDIGLVDDLDSMVEIVITDQGLRIEMMEAGGEDTFFDQASSALTPALRGVLALVAAEVAQLQNGVVIEGHTDGVPFGRTNYSNWELSVDRANVARRVLLAGGIPEDQMIEVRGYADRQLKFAAQPADPRNRRISILLPFDSPDPVAALEARQRAQEVGLGAVPVGGIGGEAQQLPDGAPIPGTEP